MVQEQVLGLVQEQAPQLLQEQAPQLVQEQVRGLVQEQVRGLVQEQVLAFRQVLRMRSILDPRLRLVEFLQLELESAGLERRPTADSVAVRAVVHQLVSRLLP